MYVVALGTVVGHSCCTALAVMGGRYVSTKISVKHGTSAFPAPRPCPFPPPLCRVQVRVAHALSPLVTVTLAASALFLLFGVVYLYEAFLAIDPEAADLHPLMGS